MLWPRINSGRISRWQTACEGAIQAVKYGNAGMRCQEPEPAAWRPQALNHEPGMANDLRLHCSESYFLQPVSDETSCRHLLTLPDQSENKTSEQPYDYPLAKKSQTLYFT